MKKILIIFFCIGFLINASEIYKLEKIKNKEIYFPIKNYEYIQNLLDANTSESFFELALVYATLGRKDISEKYLKIYEKENNDYLKISKVYNAMGEYYKEIEYLKNYLKDKSIEEKQKKYEYILELIKKNNLILNENDYQINKLDELFSNINIEDNYYKIYSQNVWNKKEKNIIIENLMNLDLEIRPIQMKIFESIASKYDFLNYYHKKIKDIGDFENFKIYFEFAEKNQINLEFLDEYEKLQYLKYKNNLDLFQEEYNKILNENIKKSNYEGLYYLYLINKNIKIIYNLALNNEEKFYEFILNLDKLNEESLLFLSIDRFKEIYPKSNYNLNLSKLKIKYMKDNNNKLKEIDNYLKENFDIEIFKEKIKILKQENNLSLIKEEIKNLILKKYEYSNLINEYIELIKEEEKNELEIFLKNLNDKFYYLEFCLKYNINISQDYKEDLKKYYFRKKEYTKLKEYKLNEKEYEFLIKNGYSEFLIKAKKDYPLNKNWKDINLFEFLIFNENYEAYYKEFDLKFIEEIEKIERKKDSEYYFLSRYYLYKEDYNKAKEFLNKIYYKYNAFSEFKNLNNKINFKLKEINLEFKEEEKENINENLEF